MQVTEDEVIRSLLQQFPKAERTDEPYRYWFVSTCLPPAILDDIMELPFAPTDLEGVSGRREIHNQSRHYFDVDNRARFPSVAAVADAFQNERVTSAIERSFGVDLGGTYLRVEFAQDVDGFWLEPHTDIGVKSFTFLLYLSKDPAHADLGTDVYDKDKNWVTRTPYLSNSGMIFVPSDITYHGFERRPIAGVRKLLVINYVTEEWRAREQLAFPEQPIRSRGLAA